MINGNRNLRDRGYPDSRSYIPKRAVNALMTEDVKARFDNHIPLMKTTRPVSDLHQTLESVVTHYKPFQESHPSLPELRFYDPTKYIVYNRPKDYTSGIIGENPKNGQKGFFAETTTNGRTRKQYSAAINGLNSVLGSDSFHGSLPFPTGTLTAAYNGDILYGSFEPTPFSYYYGALKTMLDRGEL